MKDIIKEFQLTGECKINVEEVKKQWNDYCSISQWEDEYTLLERNPDDLEEVKLKIKISKKDAHYLIAELDLVQEMSSVFRSGSIWKRITSPLVEKIKYKE